MAGAAYVRLLAMPGGSAHQTFAAMLLRATLKQLLRVAPFFGPVRKARGSGRATDDARSGIVIDDAAGDETDDVPSADVVCATPAVLQAACGLTRALRQLLGAYSLKPTPELLDLAMQVRAATTRDCGR